MKKSFVMLCSLLFVTNLFSIKAYTNNGINYYDDYKTGTTLYDGENIKLTYSFNNDPNYSLGQSKGKNGDPTTDPTISETQAIQSKTFYRSATTQSGVWSAEHVDNTNDSNRDNGQYYSQEEALRLAQEHDYYTTTSYSGTEKYQVGENIPKTCYEPYDYDEPANHMGRYIGGECGSCSGPIRSGINIPGLFTYYCDEGTGKCSSGNGVYGGAPGSHCTAVPCDYTYCRCTGSRPYDCTTQGGVNHTQKHTDYKYAYCDRNPASAANGVWSEGSEWTSTPITETANRKVQTITLYSWPLSDKMTNSAFAEVAEDINYGSYKDWNEDFEYIPFTYNSKTYTYYYVPALKICRTKEAADLYQTQEKLMLFVNDTAPIVTENKEVTLSVKAYGNTVNNYQWQKSVNNGANGANVSTNATYTFTALLADNNAQYRCCSNGVCSNIAKLTVKAY